MLKLSHPITTINGFKIGDKVRLKDGDGRSHIIKSFSIDGMKEFFFEVQFEDGAETMLDNIALLPSNLDEAAREYSERFQDEKDKLYAFHGFRDGAMWRDSQAQRLSNDVDGAAEDMLDDAAYDWVMGNFGNPKESLFDFDCRCFKAGAEWMAGQGIKLHGRILPGTRCNLYIESDCFDRGYRGLNYKFSESNDVDLFVQIRKK